MTKKSEKMRLREETKQKEKEQYEIVCQAQNKEDPLTDFPAFSKFNRNGFLCELDCKNVSDLDEKTLKWIIDLERYNMEALYNQCPWGWKEKKKLEEMTDERAKYLIARMDGKPVAFSHFRFDMDYGDAVLYCYELQLEEQVRRKGLGKFMMQILELMAFKNNMKKVVLTVLKHNKPAVNFFYSLKYSRDETNLSENVYEEIHYEILSKLNSKWK